MELIDFLQTPVTQIWVTLSVSLSIVLLISPEKWHKECLKEVPEVRIKQDKMFLGQLFFLHICITS
jgi:hypothetical protein